MQNLTSYLATSRQKSASWSTVGAVTLAILASPGTSLAGEMRLEPDGLAAVSHLSDLALNPARESTPSLFEESEVQPLELPAVTDGASPAVAGPPPYRPAALGASTRPPGPAILPISQPNALPPIVQVVQPTSPLLGLEAGLPAEQDEVVPVPGRIDATSRFTQGWHLKRVEELMLNVSAEKLRPDNAAEAILQTSAASGWPADVGSVAWWVAPNLTYQPLIFEDARLERFGYASPYFAVQPIRSGFHFTNSALLAPFRAVRHRHESESPLAFERPGSYAPPRREVFVPAVGH